MSTPVCSLTYSYLLEKYGVTMTWEQAAEELGVYWENIRKLCQRGEIVAEKVGRKWVLTTKAIADFIDNGSLSKRQVPVKKRERQRYVTL